MSPLFRNRLAHGRLPRAWRWGFAALLLCDGPPTWADQNVIAENCARSVGSSSSKMISYSCNALSITAGQTISLQSLTQGSAMVTVQGDLRVGSGAKINAGGPPTNLSLVVTGLVDLGADSTLSANLVSSAVVTTGARSIFVGNIQTGSAAINIGDHNTVTGNLSTVMAGVINIGADTIVTGELSTASGAINVGDRSTINGSILSSVAGAITLGKGVTVTGTVATTYHGSDIGAGAITVGSDSEVKKGLTTNTGAITIASSSKVCGNVVSNDGAITVGADASVCNSVCTGNSGAITVGAGAIVGGNVESAMAGAITVGAYARVAGAVTVRQAGAKTIVAGAIVGLAMLGNTCVTQAPVTATPIKIISRQWRQVYMR